VFLIKDAGPKVFVTHLIHFSIFGVVKLGVTNCANLLCGFLLYPFYYSEFLLFSIYIGNYRLFCDVRVFMQLNFGEIAPLFD
jgi:hypothetical protein